MLDIYNQSVLLRKWIGTQQMTSHFLKQCCITYFSYVAWNFRVKELSQTGSRPGVGTMLSGWCLGQLILVMQQPNYYMIFQMPISCRCHDYCSILCQSNSRYNIIHLHTISVILYQDNYKCSLAMNKNIDIMKIQMVNELRNLALLQMPGYTKCFSEGI